MFIEIEGPSCTGKSFFAKQLATEIFPGAHLFKFPAQQPSRQLTPQQYQDYCYEDFMKHANTIRDLLENKQVVIVDRWISSYLIYSRV